MTQPASCRGVFVTGTDTGVGKTVVACAITRALRRRGLRVGVMKPIETGVGPEGPEDAHALRDAAGSADPVERICPLSFALPAAPTVAAQAQNREIALAEVHAALTHLRARHDWLVVEGAGGLLVPAAPGASMADLARCTGYPLVVVARAALGTLNHTRLTLEAIERRGLELAGVVISHARAALDDGEVANLDALRSELGPLLLGEIPHLAAGEIPEDGAVDVDRLLGRAGLRQEPRQEGWMRRPAIQVSTTSSS